jgi:hypothetical protein
MDEGIKAALILKVADTAKVEKILKKNGYDIVEDF